MHDPQLQQQVEQYEKQLQRMAHDHLRDLLMAAQAHLRHEPWDMDTSSETLGDGTLASDPDDGVGELEYVDAVWRYVDTEGQTLWSSQSPGTAIVLWKRHFNFRWLSYRLKAYLP